MSSIAPPLRSYTTVVTHTLSPLNSPGHVSIGTSAVNVRELTSYVTVAFVIGPHAAFSGQPVPPSAGSPAEAPATPAAAASPSEPPKTRTAEPLDLNTATAAELEELPFVGPYMAGQIVAHRARHGPFTAVDSLVRVPGIGPATLARIRERLRVLP